MFNILSIQTCCVFKFLPIQTPRVQIYVYLDMALIIQLDDIVRVLLNTDLYGHIYIVLLNDFKIYEQVHMHKWKSSLQSPQVEILSAISPRWPGEINLR